MRRQIDTCAFFELGVDRSRSILANCQSPREPRGLESSPSFGLTPGVRQRINPQNAPFCTEHERAGDYVVARHRRSKTIPVTSVEPACLLAQLILPQHFSAISIESVEGDLRCRE